MRFCKSVYFCRIIVIKHRHSCNLIKEGTSNSKLIALSYQIAADSSTFSALFDLFDNFRFRIGRRVHASHFKGTRSERSVSEQVYLFAKFVKITLNKNDWRSFIAATGGKVAE